MNFTICRSRLTGHGNARTPLASPMVLVGLGLMLSLPAAAAAQEPLDSDWTPTGLELTQTQADVPNPQAVGAPITDPVFRDRLEASRRLEQGATTAPAAATLGQTPAGCAAILAGPNRDAALLSGDCADPLAADPGLDPPVTVSPEPSTLVMLLLPASLIMLSVVGFRQNRQRA